MEIEPATFFVTAHRRRVFASRATEVANCRTTLDYQIVERVGIIPIIVESLVGNVSACTNDIALLSKKMN